MIFHSKQGSHRSRASRSNHDGHATRSTRHQSPEPRFDIELIDLDEVRGTIKVVCRKWPLLHQLPAFLKRYYREDDDERIPDDARINLYWENRRLAKEEIPTGISTLRYRVAAQGYDDSSIVINWSSSIQLQASEIDRIQRAIEDGRTLGELRRSVASLVDVDDTNRVVILAQGGLRPGLLHGNHWEARQIRTWLCQRLWVDVTPPGSYIVLRGLNQEYLYHPPTNSRDDSIDFRNLRHWLRTRILMRTDQQGLSRLAVDSDDIMMSFEGKPLTRRDRILYGDTVDFALTREARDRYVEEEAWLLPLTTSCVVCGDDKRVSEMPGQITSLCEHKPNMCNDCIGQWIASSLDTTAWDRLRCPECPQLLSYENVGAFADRDVFARYDGLAARAMASTIRDFRWCLNPRCGYGQIVRADCSKVRCYECHAASCAHHNVPWHKGETCEQYDRRTRRQRRGERASEKKVKEIAKTCPKCHKDVYKYSGCDHITCICGHEWCYICFATYTHDRNEFLQCKHKRNCMYYDNPPEFEAIRFMPLFNPPNLNRGAGPLHPPAPAPPAAPEPHFRPWPGPPARPAGVNPFQPRPAPAENAAPRVPRLNTVFQEQWDFIRLVEDLNQQQHATMRRANMRQAEPGNNPLDAFFMFSTEQLMGRTR